MATWKIANLERNTADGGVVVAHWTCSDVDGDYSGSVYGSMGFTYDASAAGFIPYDNLTEADVIGWVQAEMGDEQVAAHEANVAAQIEAQKNPTQASGVPW